MTALRIFTIGHSNREFDDVVEMLRANGVNELVDVRSLPGSRKFPQWDRESIGPALPTDIHYRWISDLGGRRYTPVTVPSPNHGWRVKAFRDYADYMATEQFRQGLSALEEIARDRVPAIMCSEAVPWRCHRRLITDALLVDGNEVWDILSSSSTRQASLTEFAVVEGTRITYPPSGPADSSAAPPSGGKVRPAP